MDNKSASEGFSYTYSAKEREELLKIRNKYATQEKKETDKMEQLLRLDKSAGKKATAVSLIIGILGALIMGTGMSILMTDIGAFFGDVATYVGLAAGFFGMLLVICAYPIYTGILKKERARIAPEIIRLTDELIK